MAKKKMTRLIPISDKPGLFIPEGDMVRDIEREKELTNYIRQESEKMDAEKDGEKSYTGLFLSILFWFLLSITCSLGVAWFITEVIIK